MTVYSRKDSGLVAATRITKLPTRPAPQVFIHHGASPTPGATFDAEAAVWRSYQRYHMKTRGWSDIAYNFGVGQSGHSYVGRGWSRQGGATGSPQDRQSIAICAIGNMSTDTPTDAMIDEIVELILWGIRDGHLVAADKLEILGHRDKPFSTSCPGSNLYGMLSKIQRRVAKAAEPEPPKPPPPTVVPPALDAATVIKAWTRVARENLDRVEEALDHIDKAAESDTDS